MTSHPPPCLSCGRALSPVAQHGALCYPCLDGELGELFSLQDGSVEQVGARVAWLRDQGCPIMARIVVGEIPFHEEAY